ncbi:hypothetical protein Syun_002606 [Stephania yunnanensis]|uniref:DUF4378 domain-containing protein n=1 Tax=Stephania yunnanensis TaxID=152371 RepID=A0AAP0LG31_9MAGN
MGSSSKHYLKQLLDQEQEPFVLQNYIAERRLHLLQTPEPKRSSFRPETSANSDALFIHVPSRTAALLLEAALRIQRQSKPCKSHKGRHGFSVLGSILGKLGHRNNTQKRVTRDSVEEKRRCCDHNTTSDTSVSCSTRIEQRFPDYGEVENEGFASSDIFRSPGLGSPASSPECRQKQNEQVLQQGDHVLAKGFSEEEKEQSSPVSVLDNPEFEDDGDDEDGSGEVHESENEDSDVGFELERSFAIVQRTKHRLLQKLRRFEQLAELDPVELEKRILEDEDEDEEEEGEYSTDADDSSCSSVENNSTVFAREVITCSSPYDCQSGSTNEEMRGRLGSWKGTKTKTIDMMVELDLRREVQGRRKNHEEDLQDLSASIELDIFGFLVEELSDELVHDSSTCS